MWAKRTAVLLIGALFAGGCEWPEGRSFVAFDRMVVNGVRSQQTLWDMYFLAGQADLNPQGRQRLCAILADLDSRDPRIYVQAMPGQAELTQARIQAVTRDMHGYPEGACVAGVLPTTRTTVQMLPGEVPTQIVVPGQSGGDTGVNLRRTGGTGGGESSGTDTAVGGLSIGGIGGSKK